MWAVGTTTVRPGNQAEVWRCLGRSGSGWTDIFIYPGYEFRMVGALVATSTYWSA